jgi:hypothetical protein
MDDPAGLCIMSRNGQWSPSGMKEVCADVRRRRVWVSLLTFSVVGLMGSPQRADADPVAPVRVEGNATCASLGSGEYELKIEPVDSGTYDVPGFGTVTITSDRRLLDWSSTFAISAVFAKGGPDTHRSTTRTADRMVSATFRSVTTTLLRSVRSIARTRQSAPASPRDAARSARTACRRTLIIGRDPRCLLQRICVSTSPTRNPAMPAFTRPW